MHFKTNDVQLLTQTQDKNAEPLKWSLIKVLKKTQHIDYNLKENMSKKECILRYLPY